jgi:hypothetical protein
MGPDLMPQAQMIASGGRVLGMATALVLAGTTIGSGPLPSRPGPSGAAATAALPGSSHALTPSDPPTASPSPSLSASASPSTRPPGAARPAPAPVAVNRNAWSAVLRITVPVGVADVQVLREGRLIDDFPASAGILTYTDSLLWPSSAYVYEVRGLDSGGASISDQRIAIATPQANGPFPRLYGGGSFWNSPIAPNASIDPNSAAMVGRALVPYGPDANLANSADWGKPLAYANAVSRSYDIGCSQYGCDTAVSFRLPSYATPNQGSDHHLAVIDVSTGGELDMWLSAKAGDTWSAGSRYTTSANGWGAICGQGQHCGGADAAGFALMGGVILPEEIAQGRIDHALFFTTPYTRSGYIACPATNTDGQAADPNALPEGARIQLDPAFNVDAQPWPRWEKVIGHALQTYGAYLGDTGGSLALFGETNLDRGYDAWSRTATPIGPSLAGLPWSAFRVLQLHPC